MDEIASTDALSSIWDWVNWGAWQFQQAGLCFGHGTDNAEDESLALVLFALSLDHSIDTDYLHNHLNSVEQQTVLEVLLRRIQQRLPIAYITHQANFAGLSFYVDENVLVPRSPIAELILNGFYPWLEPGDSYRFLDLCTGSGCIGIASAWHMPEASVDAADISASALAVARINQLQHGLADRVTLIESDLFAALPVTQYDLIVSNPPYVDAVDMAALPDEYRHEPVLGLAAGIDGLDLVAKILRQARQYLADTGILIVEVGNSQHSLQRRYPQVPFVWLEFESGGHGVFMLSAAQLDEYAPVFAAES